MKICVSENGRKRVLGDTDAKMYKDLDFGGFITIGEDVYVMGRYAGFGDILDVEKAVKYDENPSKKVSTKFICPYCGDVDNDAWELYENEGETDCPCCESTLEYTRRELWDGGELEYIVKPKKRASNTEIRLM